MYSTLHRNNWEPFCQKLDPGISDTKLWKLTNSQIKPSSNTTITNTLKDASGNIITNDLDKANLLAHFYHEVSSIDLNPLADGEIARKARHYRNSANSSGKNKLFNEPFSCNELCDVLDRLDISKSCGPDDIHGIMLKHLPPIAIDWLLHVFNSSLKSGKLPGDWKIATVIPILKPNKPEDQPDSYRPISLTSIPGKLMERMILQRINFFLHTNNLLPNYQAAFRKNYATTDQLFHLTQSIHDNFQIKPTRSTIAAFVDFKNAFDKVWRQKLLTKLFRLGIEGRIFNWIYDFLRNRSIRVKFNNILSKRFTLKQGLPQGSILSPLLFSIYLNDLDVILNEHTKLAMFADDLVLYSSHTNLERAQFYLNEALNSLSTITRDLKIQVNTSKSETCVFTINNHLRAYRPSIVLLDTVLKFNENPKYLGVILDPSLCFHKHIDYIKTRAKKRLNILKCISGKDWGASAKTLKITYTALIRPLLEYASPIWMQATRTNLEKLEKIQRNAARVICGLRNTTPGNISEFEAGLVPLRNRWDLNLTKFVEKRVNLKGHSTGELIKEWIPAYRIKKKSTMHSILQNEIPITCPNKLTGSTVFPPYHKRKELIINLSIGTSVKKQDELPCLLKSLALEKINYFGPEYIKIYTDGSKDTDGNSGSGAVIEFNNQSQKLSHTNPKGCSVINAELKAIQMALNYLDKSLPNKTVFFVDSLAALQELQKCYTSSKSILKDIANCIDSLHKDSSLTFQWIPSHIGLVGNETADKLAKTAAIPNATIDFDLFKSCQKKTLKQQGIQGVSHHWYVPHRPGIHIDSGLSRRDFSCLSRLRTGHTRTLKFIDGEKVFPTCTICSEHQASPEHLLACMGLSRNELFSANPLQILDYLNVFELFNIV